MLLKGLFWFFASLIIGVGLDVIQKTLGKSLSSEEITFFRFFFGALTLLPFLAWNWIKKGFSITPYWKIHFFRGLLLSIGMMLWCKGLLIVPISTAIALNYSIPLFTLILSIPLLKEQVNRDRWITTIVGFIGVLIVLDPRNIPLDACAWIILVASFLFALLDVINKKYVCKESMLNMLFYTALVTCLLSAYPAFQHPTSYVVENLNLLIILGIGANLIFFCLLKAFSFMDASVLAPYRYCDFLISIVMGFVFFSEKPTLATCLGVLVIVPCTLYLTYKESKK